LSQQETEDALPVTTEASLRSTVADGLNGAHLGEGFASAEHGDPSPQDSPLPRHGFLHII